MHTAELRLSCDDARQATVLRDALQLEAEEGPGGSLTRLVAEGTDLVVRLEAADVSGLRAALNSVIRLADAAVRVIGRERIE